MTTLHASQKGLPAHEYAARVEGILNKPRALKFAPVRIALVVVGTVTGMGFLWCCAYTDLFL